MYKVSPSHTARKADYIHYANHYKPARSQQRSMWETNKPINEETKEKDDLLRNSFRKKSCPLADSRSKLRLRSADKETNKNEKCQRKVINLTEPNRNGQINNSRSNQPKYA